MPGDYLGLIWDNLLMYVFGNPVYLGMFMLLTVSILMYRLNLGLDAMLVVWIPMLFMISWSSLTLANTWVFKMVIMLLAFVVIKVAINFSGRR